jgi:hypothetical protein
MKSIYRCLAVSACAAALAIAVHIPAFADTYHAATFTGHISPGSANVKAPFNSVITQGGPISGSFIIDDNLIPAPNSGFVNVFFSSFPDIANIPDATAFTIDLGAPSLTFTLADAIQNSGAIQFNNGQFVGFFFVADFIFTDNNPYRFDDQGGTWSIKLLDQLGGSPVPLTTAKVNGHIDGMTIGQPYSPVPPPPVPEPTTILLLGLGLIGLVGIRKKSGRC